MTKPNIQEQIDYLADIREKIDYGQDICILSLPQEKAMIMAIQENLIAIRTQEQAEEREKQANTGQVKEVGHG